MSTGAFLSGGNLVEEVNEELPKLSQQIATKPVL